MIVNPGFINVDLMPILNQLTAIDEKIDIIPITDLSTVNAKLDTINNKLNQLSVVGINFTPLVLQPTFDTSYTSNGWLIPPADLDKIFDGNDDTSTNFFQAVSGQYFEARVKIYPGITIPGYTKIQIKMGLKNINNNKSLFEWSSGTGNVIRPFWSDFNIRSTSETIVNIESYVSGQWQYLDLHLQEMVTWPPQAKIYSIKVWSF